MENAEITSKKIEQIQTSIQQLIESNQPSATETSISAIDDKHQLLLKLPSQYIMETSAYPNEHEQLKEIREANVEKFKQLSVMNTTADEAQFLERTILCSKALEKYILETSAYPNEHEQLKEIRETTVEKFKQLSVMNTTADEAQFLSMLLKLMNAKNTLEIGVFTGYSLLATALALPDDGKVVAVDPFVEAYEVGLPFIKKAGVEHKIEFVKDHGLHFMNDLLNKGKEGSFDFAFVDADKKNYLNFLEPLLKLVKVGGVIAYDNTLWNGSVALLDDDERLKNDNILKYLNEHGRAEIRQLNSFLAKDPRIESTLLSIGDGLTLCRRKY